MANEIKHYGILGMKWGRRKSRQGANPSSDHTTSRIIRKKHVSEMSNEELKKLTARLQLEKQLKDLNKTDVSAGQKWLAEVIQASGKQLASKYLANAAESGGKALIEILRKSAS